MASWRTFRIHTFAIAGLSLAAALILAAGPATADTQPGRSKFFMPWEAPTYQGYSETARPTQPPPAAITAAPQKYNLVVSQIPSEAVGVEPDRIQLMAHVPEDARVWIEDAPTTSTGVERVYKSPPLAPGKEYSYTIRVAWLEDGHWVSKDAVAQVKPGQCHCFYLERAGTPAEKDADIKANLAKLPPEDRKLAEEQKFCVVESDTRLGAVGVPLKIMVKGQPVFLCCKNCIKEAQADPDKTLAKVKELKAKNAKPSGK
jgi:uncharacterized protein (TIGR03000 family)